MRLVELYPGAVLQICRHVGILENGLINFESLSPQLCLLIGQEQSMYGIKFLSILSQAGHQHVIGVVDDDLCVPQ